MRKRRRKSPIGNMDSFRDQSIKRNILIYTINLIDGLTLDQPLLAQALYCLSLGGREKIINRIYSNKKSEPDFNYSRYEDAIENIDDPSSLASVIMRAVIKINLPCGINDVKQYVLEMMKSELSRMSKSESSIDKRLKELGRIFNLSYPDISILKLIYLFVSINNDVTSLLFNNMHFDEFIHMASLSTGLTTSDIRRSLNKSGILVSGGIIENIDHTGSNFISLDDSIDEYLAGISEKNVTEKFISLDKGKKLKPGVFSIPEEDTDIIQNILSSGEPCNIVLYGRPGTGKTEYARSIASQCSERVYMLRYGEQEIGSRRKRNSEVNTRKLALRIAINTVSENGGILIADEADFLLNTISSYFEYERPEKGWLNDLLDKSRARIIWITNKTGSMEESTLRRFSYSLYFKNFTKDQRISLWNNILKRNPLKKFISADLVTELSGKYEVNAGAISSSLNALKQINAGRVLKQEEIKPLLENLLTKHSVLLNANVKTKNKLVELTGKYDLSFLNTDADINAVVHSAKKFNEITNPDKGISNINLLLWGESGTGKTEFAKYLASQTGMGLIIKRSSDLMNMYVGETEKLIRNAFKEAEEKKSILFIDEADTFFGSRERARASWEISHTNEFLVQMENFSGILICCTNLLEIFDTASMRRFNWKVKFSPVLDKMRVPLYEKYFVNDSSSLTPKQKERVLHIDYLTPGHVKAIHQRRMFSDSEIHDHDLIIDEVEKEASYMKIRSPKRMGF